MSGRTAAIAAGALMSLALLAGAGSAQAAAAPAVAPTQATVTLLSVHGVYATPKVGKLVEAVGAVRPITSEDTTLPVLSRTRDGHRRLWLRVRLPGRILGATVPPQTGWIAATQTTISSTPWHLVVNLAKREVTVYKAGKVVTGFPAVVGAASTPTPTGQYFIEENVKMPADLPGAPFALASSDRSTVLQEFEGGPGQIALHGLDNVGGDLGTAESHGCIRLADSAITWLAKRIAPGVPLTIF